MPRLLMLMVLLGVLACTAAAAPAEEPVELSQGTKYPAASIPGPDFDVERATRAYLDLLSPAQRAKSDAYYEGGYWLGVIGTVWTIAVALLLMLSGVSGALRDWAERHSGGPVIQSLLYALPFVLLFALLNTPLDFYSGFVREHQYGMSNQSFTGWLGDELKGLIPGVFVGVFVLAAVYGFLRRGGESWWVGASIATFLFSLLLNMIGPVFIAPLFNDFKPLPEGPVRQAVLSLARANGVPTDNVVWFNASKQTKRISANVSGMLGTTRVSLNDNLIERTSLPEIKAVMGHEMGHYVLNHGLRNTLYVTLLFTVGFLFVDWMWRRPLAGFIARIGIRGRADVAGAPLLFAIFSGFALLASPVQNRIVYSAEAEADIFGLNAAREPHGFATAAVRLGAYRKLEPSPLEEWLFFDHPSGRERIAMSMRWLKEHPDAYRPAPP